ncbi:MAG: nucleotidyl transferase AbiEii/AbiGii toxin family protein [Candidatus Falkowbacteria bacterium]
MHKEILSAEQTRLLPLVNKFSKDFFLVGGTAIALYLGHRESIDFDLFTSKKFSNAKIKKIINEAGEKISKVALDEAGQFTFYIKGVQFTFLEYPFKIKVSSELIKMPDLLTLAAMKAYALSRRNKWKDYVDLYFIISKHYSVKKIAAKAKQIFGEEFNVRAFREALAYFKDIDYSEEVVYLPGNITPEKEIKDGLKKFSII